MLIVSDLGLKTYDTLALSLLPDTARGKTYLFESSWKELTNSFYTNAAIAEVNNITGLLLEKTGRQTKVWISEDGSNTWTEIYSDSYLSDITWGVLECKTGLQVFHPNADKSLIGKKLKIRITIIT